jgi:pyrophosphatase PpaX
MRYGRIGFDLDGTLVDSRPAVLDALRHVLPRHVGSSPDELIETLFPLTLEGYRSVLRLHDPAAWEAFRSDFVERFDKVSFKAIAPFPGAYEVLERANAMAGKAATFLLTNRRLVSALAVLEHTGLSAGFSLVRQTVDDGTANPKVGSIRKLVAELDATGPGVYFGDHPKDAEAALGIGFDAVLLEHCPEARRCLEGPKSGSQLAAKTASSLAECLK